MLVGNQPKVEVPVPFQKDGTCEYNGIIYKQGESFTAIDGCNSCGCDLNGQVACTAMACDAHTIELGTPDDIQGAEPAL